MTRAKNGKYIHTGRIKITRGELAAVAYAIHEQAKKDGDELERPMECAKAALRVLQFDVESTKV